MYHYDYETDVLLMLRLAKYLHRQNPAALKEVLEDFPDFDLCLLVDLSERIIWEICTDVVFDMDDEYEISFCTFRHPVISRFCDSMAEEALGHRGVFPERDELFSRGTCLLSGGMLRQTANLVFAGLL